MKSNLSPLRVVRQEKTEKTMLGDWTHWFWWGYNTNSCSCASHTQMREVWLSHGNFIICSSLSLSVVAQMLSGILFNLSYWKQRWKVTSGKSFFFFLQKKRRCLNTWSLKRRRSSSSFRTQPSHCDYLYGLQRADVYFVNCMSAAEGFVRRSNFIIAGFGIDVWMTIHITVNTEFWILSMDWCSKTRLQNMRSCDVNSVLLTAVRDGQANCWAQLAPCRSSAVTAGRCQLNSWSSAWQNSAFPFL